MNLPQDCNSFQELCCDQCHYKRFPSKLEYNLHYLAHNSEPVVSLVRLSELSLEKLKHQSYKVNNGVARRTRNLVSPLRISLKKQEGSIEFKVVKVQKNDRKSDHGNYEESEQSNGSFESDTGPGATSDTVNTAATATATLSSKRDANGNKLYERHNPNTSSTRKSIYQQYHEHREKHLADNANLRNQVSCVLNQEETEQTVARPVTCGVSIAKRNPSLSKSDLPSGTKTHRKTVSVCPTGREKANRTKKSLSKAEAERRRIQKSKLLKKLTGLGFSLPPKKGKGANTGGQVTASDSAGKENQQLRVPPLKISELEVYARLKNRSSIASNADKNISYQSNTLRIREVPNEASVDNWSGIENGQVHTVANGYGERIGYKDNYTPVHKKHGRVKNSSSHRKGPETDKRGGPREVDPADLYDSDLNEYIKSACESSVGGVEGGRRKSKSHKIYNSATSTEVRGREDAAKMGVETSAKEQLQPDIIAPRLEHVTSPLTRTESQFSSLEEQNNRLQESNDCSMLLSSMQDGEDGESSNFNSVNCGDGYRSEQFAEDNNEGDLQGDEVAVSYHSLPSEGSSIDEQQDPLMSVEAVSNNGETLGQEFLHNFLNESQASHANIQPENSEYMSLERLAQGLDGQHGQAAYDMSTGEPSTPMEQLSQQVQRLPNPTMNVLSHHHMQGPQPPQMHAGLPGLAPQQAASFDHLGHIQPPPLPPSLYQGYGLFNPGFPTQGHQLPPRPPMLPQRPPMQARGFPNIAPIPRPRNRYPAKRASARLPSPQEVPQKQRRVEAVAPARSQASVSPTAKIPSGITITPARKNLEANKVANVLASRGITVTPSSATVTRQTSPTNRSQQRANPVLNLNQGVSISATTANSRPAANFAVPNPRRTSPIVNPEVERPERCATVDLTLDDEPTPSSQMARAPVSRFPCNQCQKVYATTSALEAHKASHRVAGSLPFKCDKCGANYPNAAGLQQHRVMFHKTKPPTPELAIPIIDLNHPGVRDQMARCGIYGFLPLSQLQSNSLGYFGLPIIQLDATKEKAIPNVNIFGASNVLVLGKMKSISQPQIR